MFQVAAYPIAVSIRSTNVYEEKSMGVFEEEDDEDAIEAQFDTSARTKNPKTTGNYIRYHARKQLAFDMWCKSAALACISVGGCSRLHFGRRPSVDVESVDVEAERRGLLSLAFRSS